METGGFCTSCGAELVGGARFCHACGAAVASKAATFDASAALVDEDEGNPFAAPQAPDDPQTPEPPAPPKPEEIAVEMEDEPDEPDEPVVEQPPAVPAPTPVVAPPPPVAVAPSPPPPAAPVMPPPAVPVSMPPPQVPVAAGPAIPYGSPVAHVPTVINTRGVEGPNMINFPTLTQVIDVTAGLSADLQTTRKLGLDPHVVTSLDAKLQKNLEHVVATNGLPGIGGQAMHFMKSSSTNLLKGLTPPKNTAPPEQWIVTIHLTDEEVKIYNRCLDDAMLRDGLEERVLRTCGSCKFQRIINPDYEKMMQRRRIADMMINWQRSVLRAVGRSNADPNFVCVRCQGLTYTDRTIALCPNCGTPNMSLLLSRCGQCGWDFTTRGPGQAPTKGPAPKPEADSKLLVGTCSKCGNKIKVPLDKVPPEGLKGKCSQCGQGVTFRRPAPGK